MKFMHCSDIHLGRRPVGGVGDFSNKRYNDYFTVFAAMVDQAINEKVDVLLITGDLFDRKELIPEVLSKTEVILRKLTDNGIKIILVEGNHDNITPGKEFDSWLIYLEEKDLLIRPTYKLEEGKYIFTPITIEGINFYGAGYPGCLVNETLTALSEQLKKDSNKNNIILVHTAISSSDFLPGTVDKEVIDSFKEHVLYIGGGHFHSYQFYPQKNPYFFIPGSLEYWDIAEKGERGAIIFETGSRDVTFIPSTPRTKLNYSYVIRSDNYQDFKKEYTDLISSLKIDPGEDIIIVNLELEKTFYIDVSWCEEMLLENGALKALVNVDYPGHKTTINALEEIIKIEDIESEIVAGWEFFSGRKDDVAASLTKLKLFQKEKNWEQFNEAFDHLIETLIVDEGEKIIEN